MIQQMKITTLNRYLQVPHGTINSRIRQELTNLDNIQDGSIYAHAANFFEVQHSEDTTELFFFQLGIFNKINKYIHNTNIHYDVLIFTSQTLARELSFQRIVFGK